ncbi:hypothetical protein CEXT_749001 [Caerostris extrusa]|uniref:Uncharacterized protein n=1 Tax=Caerostris extrusa TaxID=172846 RepID=A0AAV4Y3D7_CAEEX|nr:hypothetical protein CEXT_749001 [Caerostris extrusa]
MRENAGLLFFEEKKGIKRIILIESSTYYGGKRSRRLHNQTNCKSRTSSSFVRVDFSRLFSAAIVFGRRFENAECVAVVSGANISLVEIFHVLLRDFLLGLFSGRRG